MWLTILNFASLLPLDRNRDVFVCRSVLDYGLSLLINGKKKLGIGSGPGIVPRLELDTVFIEGFRCNEPDLTNLNA